MLFDFRTAVLSGLLDGGFVRLVCRLGRRNQTQSASNSCHDYLKHPSLPLLASVSAHSFTTQYDSDATWPVCRLREEPPQRSLRGAQSLAPAPGGAAAAHRAVHHGGVRQPNYLFPLRGFEQHRERTRRRAQRRVWRRFFRKPNTVARRSNPGSLAMFAAIRRARSENAVSYSGQSSSAQLCFPTGSGVQIDLELRARHTAPRPLSNNLKRAFAHQQAHMRNKSRNLARDFSSNFIRTLRGSTNAQFRSGFFRNASLFG